jgi:hypothetical protein
VEKTNARLSIHSILKRGNKPGHILIVGNIKLFITVSITLFLSVINGTKLFYTHIFTTILIKT